MFVLVVVQVIVFISGCLTKDLPPNIPKCHADDPKIGECIGRAANELRPHIRKGLKELGMPSFAPFILPTFHVNHTSDLVNYTVEAWNYTIGGMENYDITKITYNPESMTFKVALQFDSISISSLYEISGSILHVPIEGKGVARAALGPTNATFEINGNMVKRKNTDHYNLLNLTAKLNIDDMSIYFDGLFDGNLALADFTNNMLNQNSKLLAEVISPAAEVLLERLVMRYFKWLTKTFSYYQLFQRS